MIVFLFSAPKVEENVNNENIPPQEMKTISIPQPAQKYVHIFCTQQDDSHGKVHLMCHLSGFTPFTAAFF
jgi:hypothetical protein